MTDTDSSVPDEDRPPIVTASHSMANATGRDAADEPLIVAEVVEAPLPVWPVFAVGIVAICGALLLSGLTIVVAAVATNGVQSLYSPHKFQDWLAAFVNTKLGLALLVLPGQISFAAAAFGAAAFSRVPWPHRLGFRAGRLPLWTWCLFLLGTPVIGMVSAQLMTLFSTGSNQQLKLLDELFRHHSASSLAWLLLLISFVPGVTEEVLFRGYMQRRLLTRLPAAAAITLSSLFFAAAHVDPVHAVGVLPLGLWLGLLAWRADSIWPAILGHIGNNAYAIVMPLIMGQGVGLDNIDPEAVAPQVWGMLGVSVLSFIASVFVLVAPGRSNVAQGERGEERMHRGDLTHS